MDAKQNSNKDEKTPVSSIEDIMKNLVSEYGDVLEALAAGPGEKTKFDEGFEELCDKIK